MVVSKNKLALLSRLPREIILLILSSTGNASNTTCGTDPSCDSGTKNVLPHRSWRIILVYRPALPLLLLVSVGPVCHPGYAENNRAGNGPEKGLSGGCNPGAGGFSAFNPLEKGHNPLNHRRSRRKRGIDPPQTPKASSKRTARTLACHFYLHDRIGHSACLNVKLARLSDVRQHLLERTHNQAVHCPLCGTTFAGRTTEARRLRDEHVQAATCEPSPSEFNYPGITEDQDRRIREIARTARTNQYNEVQRWFMIWDCLFPGEQRPESPWLTDVPDIQRVSDWAGVIFSDTNRWLTLRNEPWTPTMSREEQNVRMSDFIQSFLAEARVLVEEDSGPLEDDQGADNSSYINVNNPDSYGATPYLGVTSLATSDFNRSADTSRRSSINPVSTTAPEQGHYSHTFGPMEPSTGQPPAGNAPIPLRPLNDATVDIAQDIQQRAAPGMATGLDDPAPPSLYVAFQDPSSDDLAVNPNINWFNSINGWETNEWETFSNDGAGPGSNFAPPDTGEHSGRH